MPGACASVTHAYTCLYQPTGARVLQHEVDSVEHGTVELHGVLGDAVLSGLRKLQGV